MQKKAGLKKSGKMTAEKTVFKTLGLSDFKTKKNGKTIELVSKKPRALDFEQILDELHKKMVLITVETNELIVTRFQGAKISVLKSGKITAESVSEAKAKKILKSFFEKISYKT